MTKAERLSKKSKVILELIAKGYSYDGILAICPSATYPDIFRAAQEALDADKVRATAEPQKSEVDYESRMEEIKASYSRAYEPWAESEDRELAALYARGLRPLEIAVRFERQPSAISSRIQKLGLKAPGKRPRSDR